MRFRLWKGSYSFLYHYLLQALEGASIKHVLSD